MGACGRPFFLNQLQASSAKQLVACSLRLVASS
jgi:hypothetical protein